MRQEHIEEAVQEAKRFLDRAKAYRSAHKERGEWDMCPIESGALRRASMDLTRALAKMRKS